VPVGEGCMQGLIICYIVVKMGHVGTALANSCLVHGRMMIIFLAWFVLLTGRSLRPHRLRQEHPVHGALPHRGAVRREGPHRRRRHPVHRPGGP
jgi:hypothetical protein